MWSRVSVLHQTSLLGICHCSFNTVTTPRPFLDLGFPPFTQGTLCCGDWLSNYAQTSKLCVNMATQQKSHMNFDTRNSEL
jgi:hypothetical protein